MKLLGSEAHTSDLVAEIVDTFATEERILRGLPDIGYLAGMLYGAIAHELVGAPMREPFNETAARSAMSQLARRERDGRAKVEEILMNCNVVASRLLWQQARIAYVADPDMWRELGRTAPDGDLPADLFMKLPHPNPFIAFPDPLVLPLNDQGDQQRIVGVFVSGLRDVVKRPMWGVPCSTSDPCLAGLAMTFVGLVEKADGTPILIDGLRNDLTMIHASMSLKDGRTFGELVEGAVRRYSGPTPFSRQMRDRDNAVDLPLLFERAIGALLYLCCKNADLRPLPAVATRTSKRRSGRGAKPPKLIGMGYRIGPQLRAYHKRVADEDRDGGTGWKKAPHLRRAHYHTYRVGPGRRESIMMWLHPIFVNATPDGAEETTVIPIGKG